MLIPREDLLVESFSNRPKGGQHVGVDHGVKVTHIPTGLVAISVDRRSQFKNRQVAENMILAGLTDPC